MVLFELLISILLFSIVSIFSLKIILELYKKNETSYFQTVNILKLESTRLFLTKNNDFSKLTFSNDKLNYNGDLLLSDVSKYNLKVANDIASIDICIYDNKICQIWKIKI